MTAAWGIDLPNWHRKDDPEIAGSPVWCHTDYDGAVDICLIVAEELQGGGYTAISVLVHPMILPAEVDGLSLGEFPDWDTALDFALAQLEVMP